MMSALEEGGSWKSGPIKGGCVHFVVKIRSKCGQCVERVKNQKVLWTSILEASLDCKKSAQSKADQRTLKG